MARLRFIGPGEMCQVFGRVFVAGEWEGVDGMHPDDAATLRENPTFEAEPEAGPEPEAKAVKVRGKSAEG